ncbi:hypothetical protein CMUS01_04192 [Colletotrichum musicola]|uniref:Uncharacterized protein n=1 Tax=Colletotrichum musicola TaxID=2175873 RepID=A0A8H6KYK9_9PEZI|nr:hypothetical protein CMUS01_04192 [Colletotrichum musicola]
MTPPTIYWRLTYCYWKIGRSLLRFGIYSSPFIFRRRGRRDGVRLTAMAAYGRSQLEWSTSSPISSSGRPITIVRLFLLIRRLTLWTRTPRSYLKEGMVAPVVDQQPRSPFSNILTRPTFLFM